MRLADDFIPRFSVLVVIEVLAYFFLKLYKKNLDNITKLQSEVTVIENRILAYQSALLSDNQELKEEMIRKFSSF